MSRFFDSLTHAHFAYAYARDSLSLLELANNLLFMRLLQLQENGGFSLVEYVGKNIPRYAIL